MNKAQRYDHGRIGMIPTDSGYWYQSSDYAKLEAEAQALRAEVAALRTAVGEVWKIKAPQIISHCLEQDEALRARVVDDPDGDFRSWFEGWALETEHPVFGYIGSDWLDQGDAPNTYGNEYIQGAWVMAQFLRKTVSVVQDERAAFEKHCMSLGWEVRHLKRKTDRPDVYDDWSIQPMWLAWHARARLNGKVVSEGLLRRCEQMLQFYFEYLCDESAEEVDITMAAEARDELRALLGEGKEVGDGCR